MVLQNKQASGVTQYAMGTVMAHKAYGDHAEEAVTAVCREIDRIEGLLSRFLPASDISRINASAGTNSQKIRLDTFDLLAKSVELSRRFPTWFDVTIGPLVDLWRTARDTHTQPEDASIQAALALVGAQDVILDRWEMTAGLRNPEQSIDLGGIGKGFAGDRILNVYKSFGITAACSNLGGNVVALGSKPDLTPWQVGIQHPRHENQLIGVVSVQDQTVVTSGDYQRYSTDNLGRRHHHILDIGTGYPARSGLVSVSVVSNHSILADVLSTALFVAGLEKGVDLLRNYPQTEAVFVDGDLQVFVTSGLKDRFQAERGIDMTILGE